ncbi:aspartate--ammonia ligase [Lactiplantibacillus mudanjiangensis]|uniref:Aspartate--ammonia ligase n=1 Tax=Lactiplantibacillus mudanjiangensis TaxID=1296538 RepID=A0A660E8K0_9LACO|nr:aspartate--ammonia ligase [Lactiplantibacillus mudanjiangensis]VDG17776.1 aspartate-ammonia ligase [Lactobacillus brevis ATCC 367] [Lactiplantibacillus mudanjiangensis]VDG26307.1 aspartate-ammonia ligase [Lactobacillus brevis ATCC 367] [Lactiplantibacillus mudanjiangensis]VDG29419.1 aspartate-ammonia ligase [Lactobacillus brevis ATCC 367] [Lactiplantibacillus mudanjiangensis]VDG32533.1 aspartate-ammonia ligase [Lactobacillus brevis ATCC 367] [Lactiplantibacillus mudanjiangensis]
MHLIIPKSYDPKLSVRETQTAIRYIRETFQEEFGKQLNLSRISAPMFVEKKTGLNDNLNGVEKPVSFTMQDMGDETIEIVHSLAKWKRVALKRYGFDMHEGLYTNMNAIRKDEDLDNYHSAYVDQWDWEKVIAREDRTIDYLQKTVKQIFKVIKHMEHEVWYKFPKAVHHLPDEIHFITTQELEDRWPDKTPRERENAITKELGCVFIMKIGGQLLSGKRHDGRAPDYDDWSLNGDIMFWYEPLDQAIEISSMGIRVDAESMKKQLKIADAEDRLDLPYHQMVLNEDVPFTIGGGIGQSRLCMLLLGKAHVGEVQTALWPDEMVKKCEAAGIHLL